jgi:dTDP-4-dehydrorhamnose 3,5-epimerase
MGIKSVKKTFMEGLLVVEPQIFRDERGYFTETYNHSDYSSIGIDAVFVQDNESQSEKGVVRGMHMQQKAPQAKLVRVVQGSVFDVAVDVRSNSNTFGQWFGIELNCDNKLQLYIPEGFLHGFQVLSESVTFAYKCSNYYSPKDEVSVRFDDKDLNIGWKIVSQSQPKISCKDARSPTFKEFIAAQSYGESA